MNTFSSISSAAASRVDAPEKSAAPTRERAEIDRRARFPGWVRLMILLGAPGLFWAGVAVLIVRRLHH